VHSIIIVGLCLIHFGHNIIFPLGNQFENEEYFWSAGGHKLLYYLQGNCEIPRRGNPTIQFFIDQGWDVCAGGYSDNTEETERLVLERYERYAQKYATTAVYARSLGTCFAPAVCREFPSKILFAIYATPVTSIQHLFNWHTSSILWPFVHSQYMWNKGVIHHPAGGPRCHIIEAKDDTLIPSVHLQQFITMYQPNAKVWSIDNADHNSFVQEPRYLEIMQDIVVKGE